MNVVKEIRRINDKEANLGLSEDASWHSKYKDSAYIFVGGLEYDLTEGDVLAVFSQYGEIVDVNLIREKTSGKSKGFAFLCFEDQRSTTLAVDNFNGSKLCGRILRVDHCAKYKPPKIDEAEEKKKKEDEEKKIKEKEDKKRRKEENMTSEERERKRQKKLKKEEKKEEKRLKKEHKEKRKEEKKIALQKQNEEDRMQQEQERQSEELEMQRRKEQLSQLERDKASQSLPEAPDYYSETLEKFDRERRMKNIEIKFQSEEMKDQLTGAAWFDNKGKELLSLEERIELEKKLIAEKEKKEVERIVEANKLRSKLGLKKIKIPPPATT